MDNDCIFCKIVAGEIPCAKVFESETCLGFLDIAPVNKGHALVLPKAHHPALWDLPAGLGEDLMAAMKAVSVAVRETTGAHGLNVMQNNLEAAGQLVPHLHFHVIPRFSDDGLQLWAQGSYASGDEMNALAESIRRAVE
ncbi:HIT family protein [Pseudodesulfovibrio senegalensis]|jgi:histidine triad (HIT) family protein|uniref:HIT family protein n=1 Tax=Pseudodesulfovibrio senegalensis TaxID=1721087 RepID=A0A6N6N1K9_9BACT|nr:HIT family protein [Pseudodesulfovibrio senegalensis]KAB1441784.1 HIT family protein [Pseudodesulfovibrio senegalensis]